MESTNCFTNTFTNQDDSKVISYGRVQFIEIQNSENKKIKIPCANEKIATNVMNRLKRLKTASTITLLA